MPVFGPHRERAATGGAQDDADDDGGEAGASTRGPA